MGLFVTGADMTVSFCCCKAKIEAHMLIRPLCKNLTRVYPVVGSRLAAHLDLKYHLFLWYLTVRHQLQWWCFRHVQTYSKPLAIDGTFDWHVSHGSKQCNSWWQRNIRCSNLSAWSWSACSCRQTYPSNIQVIVLSFFKTLWVVTEFGENKAVLLMLLHICTSLKELRERQLWCCIYSGQQVQTYLGQSTFDFSPNGSITVPHGLISTLLQ